ASASAAGDVQLIAASACSYSALARGVPRSGDEKVELTVPSLSSTKVARFAQPSASLNTPYALATSPWGQTSLSTGNVNPCSSAQMRCEWPESHEMASTCAPPRSNAEGSSRISQSSPWQTPVNVNG